VTVGKIIRLISNILIWSSINKSIEQEYTTHQEKSMESISEYDFSQSKWKIYIQNKEGLNWQKPDN
jgi:hypothetical protein